jgi:hypothetical protein
MAQGQSSAAHQLSIISRTQHWGHGSTRVGAPSCPALQALAFVQLQHAYSPSFCHPARDAALAALFVGGLVLRLVAGAVLSFTHKLPYWRS